VNGSPRSQFRCDASMGMNPAQRPSPRAFDKANRGAAFGGSLAKPMSCAHPASKCEPAHKWYGPRLAATRRYLRKAEDSRAPVRSFERPSLSFMPVSG